MAKAPAKGSKKKSFKKKEKKNVPVGLVHVQATFNNTIITITDALGNVLSWSSSGSVGLPRLAQGHPLCRAAGGAHGRDQGQGSRRTARGRRASRGPGSGRESAIRALSTLGIEVKSIRDVTPIPHNGCRPPKRRRV